MQDDGTLLYRRFLDGDVKALEQLIELYRRGLLRFIYGYVKDESLAEDILTDVFCDLYFKRKFREMESATLKTYLYTVARNKALNLLKKQRRQREFSLNALLETGALESEKGFREYVIENSPTPDMELERKEGNERLYKALEQIPESYREVLILRYFDGLSPERIAKVLGRSKKQVYNLLGRGKTALKKQLLGENGNERL